MLWIQGFVCFLGWVALGVWLAKSGSAKRMSKVVPLPRLSGPLLMILGMVLLTGGLLVVVQLQGLDRGSLQVWAWITVLAVGALFVAAQSVAAVTMVEAALGPETGLRHQTSEPRKELK